MSLIKCSECGREISDKAAACPHCGCPVNLSDSPSAVAQTPVGHTSAGAQTPAPAKGRAVGTIVFVTILILVLGALAAWFLFFRGGNDTDERVAYDRIIRYQNEEMLDSLGDALNEYFDTYNADAYHYSQLKALNDRFTAERADWQAAEGIMSLEAVRHFLDVHPDGLYLKQANHKLDSLSFFAAADADSSEAYEQYLARFPQGAYVAQAREKMKELDKVELTVEEKSAVQEVLNAHFDALAQNEKARIASTLAAHINSYIGKTDPELEDIYAYMQNMHSSSRVIVFLVKNAHVTKVNVEGRVMYNVQFSLDEETYTHGQHSGLDTELDNIDENKAPEPADVKHFTGAAVLNESMKITSLVLRQ